jgi:hypothetical protein
VTIFEKTLDAVSKISLARVEYYLEAGKVQDLYQTGECTLLIRSDWSQCVVCVVCVFVSRNRNLQECL